MKRIHDIIKQLNLQPHPEGGYFSEIYRSSGIISDSLAQFPSERNYSTAIYYLLGSDDISRLHRIKSDEVWHHYEGSPVTIHIIHKDGLYRALNLGKKFNEGQQPQHVVPAGAWFGATVDKPETYTLCGCTVSPGFDFKDFEMADQHKMLQDYPEHEAIIKQLLP